MTIKYYFLTFMVSLGLMKPRHPIKPTLLGPQTYDICRGTRVYTKTENLRRPDLESSWWLDVSLDPLKGTQSPKFESGGVSKSLHLIRVDRTHPSTGHTFGGISWLPRRTTCPDTVVTTDNHNLCRFIVLLLICKKPYI